MSETNSDDKKVLLTVEQACERLSISRRTFYRLLNADQLKTAKIFLPGNTRGMRRVHVRDLERFAAAMARTTS